MRKKSIAIILIMILSLFVMSSCFKAKNDVQNAQSGIVTKVGDNKNTIQLWYYYPNDSGYYTEAISRIVEKAKEFCKENDIPLEVVALYENAVSYNDYVLKRNLATVTGNMIIIEDARFLQDIAKQHADYTKLKNYDNLMSSYKDRFCIPLGVGYRALYIENKALEHYGINVYEKPVITLSNYFKLKQQMKEKGAKFELNKTELSEIIQYYLDMNGLLFTNETSDIINNEKKFKEMLKKSILDVCNDIVLYNDVILDMNSKTGKLSNEGVEIYDEKSELVLREKGQSPSISITVHDDYKRAGDINTKTFVVNTDYTFRSPCLYISKKITNEKLYDLANHIVDESTYLSMRQSFYSPVFDMENTRNVHNVDDNWKTTVNYEVEREKMILDNVYELIVKNNDSSKEIADSYYSNQSYKYVIREFIEECVYDIARKLSVNSTDSLSLEDFDYNNEEINKLADYKVNEFIKNFYIHND